MSQTGPRRGRDIEQWTAGGLLWRSLLCINLIPLCLAPLGVYGLELIPPVLIIGLGWVCAMACAVWVHPRALGMAWARFGLRIWAACSPIAIVLFFAGIAWLRVALGAVEVIPSSAYVDVERLGASTGRAPSSRVTDFNRRDYYAVAMPLLNAGPDRADGKEVWAIAYTWGPGTRQWRTEAHRELVQELQQTGEWIIDPQWSGVERSDWAARAVAQARKMRLESVSSEVAWATLEVPEVDRSAHRAWTLSVWGLSNLCFVLWWVFRLRRQPRSEASPTGVS